MHQLTASLAICLTAITSSLFAQAPIPGWCRALPRPEYKSLDRVATSDPWFEVCASTTARIGGQLCGVLRDAVDGSAKYEEHIGTPGGYALRIVAVDINDGTQTAVSMTLLYRWAYVSSAVQVCSLSGLNECAHTMMSSVDEDIRSFKERAKDQVATQRHP